MPRAIRDVSHRRDIFTRRRPDTPYVTETQGGGQPMAPWRTDPVVIPSIFTAEEDHRVGFDTVSHTEPTPASRKPRKPSRAQYDAMETHGCFGLVDTHETTAGYRGLIAHLPKNSRTYTLDMRVGDTLQCNAVVRGSAVGGSLTVGFVTPHRYYRPGMRVTTCVIGVPEEEWTPFEQPV